MNTISTPMRILLCREHVDATPQMILKLSPGLISSLELLVAKTPPAPNPVNVCFTVCAFCKFSLCQCALSSFNKLKSKNMVAFKNLTGTVKGAMMWHIHIQAYTYKHTHTTMQ